MTLILLLMFQTAFKQAEYGTPPEGLIPEKIQNIPRTIEVFHFPKINDPIKIKNRYYWKHSTGILSKTDNITIIEYGAFLYYNNQWNLRKTYEIKELDKTFGTKKQKLDQAQPYIWKNNWRTDNRLFGGWALWYFIGIDSSGKKVCGYETIHTSSNLLNN